MQHATFVEDECGSRAYARHVMNRIREIREAAGLTRAKLAEMAGTTENTIWRLEDNRIKLTHEWMTVLAEALQCTPADLIANVVMAEIDHDVEEVAADAVTTAIAARNLRVYKVIGRSVLHAGIKPGDLITVDESRAAIDQIKGLDVVLVAIGPDRNKVLRQFVPPGMLITNRGGANLAISLSDPTVTPEVIGVVLRH